jgi:hypothetical protein
MVIKKVLLVWFFHASMKTMNTPIFTIGLLQGLASAAASRNVLPLVVRRRPVPVQYARLGGH